jgi:hypothetical protein
MEAGERSGECAVILPEATMAEDDAAGNSQKTGQDCSQVPLPLGYRQGIITAITVLLGFSLVFLRYWGFELPGKWNVSAVIAAGIAALAVVFQMVALWRSLQLEDDNVTEYKKTLRWFLWSAILLMASLVCSYASFLQLVKW